jgi:hypothetical protein
MYNEKHYLSFSPTGNHKKDTNVSEGKKIESENTMTMIHQEMIHRKSKMCMQSSLGSYIQETMGQSTSTQQ